MTVAHVALNVLGCLYTGYTRPNSTTECIHSTCCTGSVYARCSIAQGIGIKGKEMALVWHEQASRTALQTSSVNLTHTLLLQTHNMITVKEITEQCCQL